MLILYYIIVLTCHSLALVEVCIHSSYTDVYFLNFKFKVVLFVTVIFLVYGINKHGVKSFEIVCNVLLTFYSVFNIYVLLSVFLGSHF